MSRYRRLIVTVVAASLLGFTVSKVWSKDKSGSEEKSAAKSKGKSKAKPEAPKGGDDADAKGQPGEADMEAMMAKWMAVASPGENHKHLEYFVGEWDMVTKMYMAGPDGPASESKGTSTVKWVLGGRYIEDTVNSEIMMPGEGGEMAAVPFEGRGLTGYDNFRKQYVSTWCDSMSTSLMVLKGVRDADGKTWRYYGEMDEPMTDDVGHPVKFLTTIQDDDTYTFELYDLHGGEDQKVMEVTYTRRK